MKDFERSSAQRTRRALLDNDAQLCVPHNLQQKAPESRDGNDEERQQQQQQPALSRFAPGDPFANEEADVDEWVRHFTYLSVVPSKSDCLPLTSSSSPLPSAGDGCAGERRVAGAMGLGCSQFGENRPPATTGVAMAVESMASGTETVSAEGASAAVKTSALLRGTSSTAPVVSSRDEAERMLPATLSAARKPLPSSTNNSFDAAPSLFPPPPTISAVKVGTSEEMEGDTQGEEVVLASHGVYEEYLAYDCRPPEAPSGFNFTGDGDGTMGELGGRGLSLHGANATDSHCTRRPGQQGLGTANITSSNSKAVEEEIIVLQRQLDTPQQELREEIMDRLFDELWRRLTPELLVLLATANSKEGVGVEGCSRSRNHHGREQGGNKRNCLGEVGAATACGATSPRDSMEL